MSGFDPGGAGELGRLTLLKEQRAANRGITVADEGVSTLWILLALLATATVAIGLVKLLRRRSRYLTRDPRRIAGATRRELADFLLDQGLSVQAERDARGAASARPGEARHRRSALRRRGRAGPVRAARPQPRGGGRGPATSCARSCG